MTEVARETLVESEGRKLEIIFYEDEITHVSKTDNPQYFTENQKKTYYTGGNTSKEPGTRTIVVTPITTVTHHYSTHVTYAGKTDTLTGNWIIQPGMHVRSIAMKLDDYEEIVGSALSELNCHWNMLLPSGFIHNKVILPIDVRNGKPMIIANGMNSSGKHVYTLCTSINKKTYTENSIINKYRFFNVALWILLPILYFIFWVLCDFFEIEKIGSFFNTIKLPFNNTKMTLRNYSVVALFFTCINFLNIKSNKKKIRNLQEIEKKQKEAEDERNKDKIESEKRFREACTSKLGYANELFGSFLKYKI